MSAVTISPAPGARLPGLDGLRALAITLVLAYHLFPGLAPGGFIGVDVFLVVSGYLITALLIAEKRSTGSVRLRRFWARRARRLLPALVVVIGVSATVAAIIGGDVLVGIQWQLAGALTFSSNWWSIANGASYLDQTSPELFRHLWSLAVEEQFYLIWPLVTIALLALPVRRLRITLPLTLALASAVAMGIVAGDPAVDPAAASTAYFSTLTHGFGLLLGAGLALAREPLATAAGRVRPAAWAADLAAALAALGLVALAIVLSIDSALTYRGGLVAAVLLTGVLIVSAAHPTGKAAGVLDAPLPRWLGERSYGLYLWHWPVIIVLGAALPAIDRWSAEAWALGGIALVISIALAALSWRFVEQPVRERTLVPALRGGAGWSRTRRVTVAGLAGALVVTMVAGTAAAVVRAPERSQAAEYIVLGAQHLAIPPAVPLKRPRTPPEIEPPPPAGAGITAIGDSVMLASAPYLAEQLPGIEVHAAVSRQMREAPTILTALIDDDRLGDVVVIGLGTNGPIAASTLHQIRRTIGAERRLVLVSVQAPRGWIAGVNETLRDFDDRFRYVVIADWHGTITPQLGLLARDQVHPGAAGGRVYAQLISEAVDALRALPPPDPPPPGPGAPTLQ
ncbi:MAG: acetyltransferase [Microcella sp.]|uniref:acyltransferase family protein n=1 Tax=Microcella sp. TaxID=1913979 RepID=UPI0024CDE7F7|nr:acyltransferase family protein [Microcella sp.]UYN83325.1 MAG: acetyltransferase [Microcella sp.]